MKLKTLTAIMFAAMLGACGSSTPNPDALAEDFLAESALTVELLCECFDDYGYTSEQECIDENTLFDAITEQCILDEIYLFDNVEQIAYGLECRYEVAVVYNDCIANTTCGDELAVEDCEDDADYNFSFCADFPDALDDAINENCFAF